jgi:hypothetical protein
MRLDDTKIEIACDFRSGYNSFMADLAAREGDDGKSDTPAKVQEIQLSLLRKAGTPKRLMLTLLLSEAAISFSRQGLKRRYPELTPNELDLLFIDHCYGASLAKRCRILRQEESR